MKVLLKKDKNFHPIKYKSGDIADIPDRVACRWIERNIAEIFMEKSVLSQAFKLNKRVSIVILVKDALKYFKMCLDSVIKYTSNYELIIVDNGSGKTTKKYLEDEQAKLGFSLITNKENKGFSYGNNQAIKLSTCNYICFLNSDCVVTKGWLSRLMEGFEMPYAGIIGPSTSWCGGEQCIKSMMGKHDTMTLDEINAVSLEAGTVECDPMGFCYLVSKEVIDKIGVFDWKRYGLGLSEEKDFNWRAVQAGFKLYWVKDVYVHHWGNKTWKEIGLDPYKLLSKNRSILSGRIKNDPNIFIENDAEIGNIKKTEPRTDVIIPVLDREAETTKTLESLFKNNSNINVLIIDNGSDNLDYLKDFDVKIIKNSTNLGVTKTLNQGLRLAKSKYIVLMHNDIDVKTKDWIKKAIDFMESNTEVGAVGQAGWKRIDKNGRCGDRAMLRTSIEKYERKPSGDFEQVVILDGCCNVIRNIGLALDEELGYYFYDFDMSMQYQNSGYKLYVMNGSAIHFADDRKKATINLDKCKRTQSEENLYWRQSFTYFMNKWKGALPLEIQ